MGLLLGIFQPPELELIKKYLGHSWAKFHWIYNYGNIINNQTVFGKMELLVTHFVNDNPHDTNNEPNRILVKVFKDLITPL